jgi:hypothetical protein
MSKDIDDKVKTVVNISDRWKSCIDFLMKKYPEDFTNQTAVRDLPEKFQKIGLEIFQGDALISAIPKIEEFITRTRNGETK